MYFTFDFIIFTSSWSVENEHRDLLTEGQLLLYVSNFCAQSVSRTSSPTRMHVPIR